MGFRIDLTGKTFGYVRVLSFAGNQPSTNKSLWNCRCICGKEWMVLGHSLSGKRGNTRSCGCRFAEFNAAASTKTKGQLTGTYWCRVRNNAIRRKIPLKITQEEAAELFETQSGLCALSGVEIKLYAPIKQVTASLDRIDSSKGYERGNIQWVHKQINLMKNEMSLDEFLVWSKRISNHVK